MGTQLAPPQFSAHAYCGQTAGSIKVGLGRDVGLGPRHIVLDQDSAPLPKKRSRAPNFRPIFIVAKRLDTPRYATWHGGSPQPRRLCVKW